MFIKTVGKLVSFVVILCLLVFSGLARAEVLENDAASFNKETLKGLSFIERFTVLDPQGDIQTAYSDLVNKLKATAGLSPNAPEYAAAVAAVNDAYLGFLEVYEARLSSLRAIAEDPTNEEIFAIIDWDAEAFQACVRFREELVELLRAANPEALRPLAEDATALNDQLANCEGRIQAASARLVTFIEETDAALARDRAQLEQLKKEFEAAQAAGDTDKANELQARIDQLEDEEIPKKEQQVQKAREVKRGFDIEKFLEGLGKVVLGVVTIIFSGECGEDAEESCNAMGVELLKEGGDDIAEAFNPPPEQEFYTETTQVDAPRPESAVNEEKDITEALELPPSPVCACLPVELIHIPTDEEGPLSFTYSAANGAVSSLTLVRSADGAPLATVTDEKLFFAEAENVTLSAFSAFTRGKTVENTSGGHVLLLDGSLIAGGVGQLAIAISPLTYSGKYRVVMASAPK